MAAYALPPIGIGCCAKPWACRAALDRPGLCATGWCRAGQRRAAASGHGGPARATSGHRTRADPAATTACQQLAMRELARLEGLAGRLQLEPLLLTHFAACVTLRGGCTAEAAPALLDDEARSIGLQLPGSAEYVADCIGDAPAGSRRNGLCAHRAGPRRGSIHHQRLCLRDSPEARPASSPVRCVPGVPLSVIRCVVWCTTTQATIRRTRPGRGCIRSPSDGTPSPSRLTSSFIRFDLAVHIRHGPGLSRRSTSVFHGTKTCVPGTGLAMTAIAPASDQRRIVRVATPRQPFYLRLSRQILFRPPLLDIAQTGGGTQRKMRVRRDAAAQARTGRRGRPR